MADTSRRLLRLLSLLQTPREWPGSELARRLEVSPRTVRRDVDRLRDLGYPVHATVGAIGGYRLAAGTAMPPLLLDDDEAIAVAVGLRTAAAQAVAGIDESSLSALAKLEQVLPARLRRRVNALNAATVTLPDSPSGPGADPQTLAMLAAAAAAGERLRFGYRSADGTESRRRVEPHRLVCVRRRWYLLAYDNQRDDWRTFRIERITEPFLTGVRTPPRPLPAPDTVAYVTSTIYDMAPTYQAVATLHAPVTDMRRRLGDTPASLEPVDDRSCVLRTHPDTVEWLAFRLTMLGCEFEVHEPPELVDHLHAMSARISRAGGRRPFTAPADGRRAGH